MNKILNDPVSKFFISVIGLVVIVLVLKELQFIFIPLAIAYFLYFVFEPINKILTKKENSTGFNSNSRLNYINFTFLGYLPCFYFIL